MRWSSSRSIGEYDVEGGIDAKLDESNRLPFTVWGKVSKYLLGYDVSVRGAVRSKDPSAIAVSVNGRGESTTFQVDGTAGSIFNLGKVQVKKTFEKLGGKVMVHPSYNVKANKGDIAVAYSLDKTAFKLDAGKDIQKLVVSRIIGAKNRITPSITSRGKVKVDFTRDLDELGSLTTGLDREAVNLRWDNGPSAVQLYAPFDGLTNLEGVNVKFIRKVEF